MVGASDERGANVVERVVTMGDLYATIYQTLGIDWKKEITNTPSKRAYRYIDVLGATEFVMDDEIVELFV